MDQASNHTVQTSHKRPDDFELNITEDSPTVDQVKTILEYVGPSKISTIVSGAENEKDALRKFNMDPNTFQRPVVSCASAATCAFPCGLPPPILFSPVDETTADR